MKATDAHSSTLSVNKRICNPNAKHKIPGLDLEKSIKATLSNYQQIKANHLTFLNLFLLCQLEAHLLTHSVVLEINLDC